MRGNQVFLLAALVGLQLATVLAHECSAPYLHFADHMCLLVKVSGKQLTWQEARTQCQQTNGGDLAILDHDNIFKALSDHIGKNFQDGDTFWVGGSGSGNTWTWVNNEPIQSSHWQPNSPSSQTTSTHYTLVTAKINGHRYLQDSAASSAAFGYICEQDHHHHHDHHHDHDHHH